MKYYLIILSNFFVAFIHAKQIDLSVQTGHSESVNEISFSHNGELIASASDDQKIILWDFYSGRQFAELLGHTKSVNSICFSSDDNLLISASDDSTCILWDIKKLTPTSVFKFNFPVKKVIINQSNTKLFVVGKQVLIFDIATKKSEAIPIISTTSFNAIALSSDEKLMAFGGSKDGITYICNLETKDILKRIPASSTDLKFATNDSSMFYCTSNGILGESGVYYKQRKSISTDWMLNGFNEIETLKSNFIGCNDLGEIYVIDTANFQLKKILKDKKVKINCIAIYESTGTLAAGLGNGKIILWDLNDYFPFKELSGSVQSINSILFNEAGDEMLICYGNGVLRKSNLITNQTVLNSPSKFSNKSDAKVVWSSFQINHFNNDSAVIIMLKKRIAIDELKGFDKIEAFETVWNFKENQLKFKPIELPELVQKYLNDRKKGQVGDERYLLGESNRKTISTDSIYQVEISNEFIKTSTKFKVADYLIKSKEGFKPTSLAINNAFNFMAISGQNGLIEFRNLKDGNLLLTFGPFQNGQFIYLTEDGFYLSSKRALDYLSYRVDSRLYSFDQFDLIYNRPDLVAAKLPYFNQMYVEAYKNAYKKRLQKLGLTEDKLMLSDNAPKVKIQKSSGNILTTGFLDLMVNCEESESELDRLHIKVNGVPEYGRLGKKISGKNFSDSIKIELNPGENFIQVYCTNKNGVASLQESFYAQGMKQTVKHDLYVIALGVSNYVESNYNLNFASKDAKDFVRFFTRPNLIYNETYSLLLTDSMVTLNGLSKLNDFLQKPGPNDVVLCFIAGHGVLDKNYDYFLASHDMNFKNPSDKGIPYEFFETLLDNTRSRKKVLFIDACHSGEIDKEDVIETEVIETEMGDIKFRSVGTNLTYASELNAFDLSKTLFADMRLNNGTTVISSSGGTEFAIESESWSNGAFTYCLLYGLSSGDADLNKDHIIALSELQEYLFFQVNKITNGKQTPTSRAENLNNDFQLK